MVRIIPFGQMNCLSRLARMCLFLETVALQLLLCLSKAGLARTCSRTMRHRGAKQKSKSICIFLLLHLLRRRFIGVYYRLKTLLWQKMAGLVVTVMIPFPKLCLNLVVAVGVFCLKKKLFIAKMTRLI